jgi:hypothetical protein
MKINKKLLLEVLAPLALAFFLYFLTLLPLSFVLGGLIAYYIFLIVYPLFRNTTRKDDMQSCWEYFCDWWYKFRKEDISSLDAKGFERYFGDDKFIAFIVNRGSVGEKKHMPLVCVVKSKGPEVVDWDDNPNFEKLENPFKDISPCFTGTPSPTIKPELEPVLRGRKFVKEKEEKEEKEEEVEA